VDRQADTIDADDGKTTLADDLRLLARDGRAYAEAELAYQKSRASILGKRIRSLALLAFLALVFATLALLTLPVGLVLALAPEVGIWPAIGIAVLAFLLASGLCLAVAAACWKRTLRLLTGGTGRNG